MTRAMDLFEPVVAKERLDPMFLQLFGSADHAAARAYINAAFARMGDPNGHFAANFQGQGFHARLFEMACFSYLEAAGLVVGRGYQAPDFMASKGDTEIAIEVMTAAPPDGADRDIGATRIENLPLDRIIEKTTVEFPRRMESALRKKALKGYHRQAHVAGKPIVLMAQPAFEAGANFYIDDSLAPCLFGGDDGTPGYFDRDYARPISAVAYCNGFTVSKFWRLSAPELFRTRVRAMREGSCLLELADDPCVPRRFRFEVGHPTAPRESWSEGVTLFLNPNAAIPLPPDLLPASCTTTLIGGRLPIKCISGFHPLASTMIARPRRDQTADQDDPDARASRQPSGN